MKNKKKYLLGFIFAIIATITILILFSGIRGFVNSLQELAEYKYFYLYSAIALITFKWLVESAIIKLLLPDITLKHALNFTLIGQFYSYLTPFYTGGQPFQIVYITKHGIDPSKSTATILFKTFIFQITMAIFGVIAIIYSYFNFPYTITIGIISGVLLNSFVVFLILFYVINQNAAIKTTLYFVKLLKKIGILKNPDKHFDEIIVKVKTFINIFKNESRKICKISLVFLLSIFQFACSFLVLPVVLKGFNKNINLNTIFRSLITQITASVVPTPGTSGGAESIFYLVFSDVLPQNKIPAVIILWRFSIYYYVLLIGGIVVLFNHRYKKTITK